MQALRLPIPRDPATIAAQPPTPAAPTVGLITNPTCLVSTGSVALSNLPSGSWTVTASPGGLIRSGSGTTYTFSGLPAGNYTFTVENASTCVSLPSGSATIAAQPPTPAAPTVGLITNPTCLVSTGSVALSNLPSGSWTVTASPGGLIRSGSGTTYTFSGLPAGNYTFTVENASTCVSLPSGSATIAAQPPTPAAPTVGLITNPTCLVSTGSVALSNLPSGSWTVTASPGGLIRSGSGTTYTFSGLPAGNYTFTVENASTCVSLPSGSATIAAQPPTPAAPTVGLITNPTCLVSTGSVALSNLPSGSWTVTASPGGLIRSGSGTTTTFSGLPAGNYTFTVENASTCVSLPSGSATYCSTTAHTSRSDSGTYHQSHLPCIHRQCCPEQPSLGQLDRYGQSGRVNPFWQRHDYIHLAAFLPGTILLP